MKTIKQWLEQLPEPYRTQAIENTYKERLELKCKSVEVSLVLAFIWIKSPQGYYYWNDLYETIKTN